MSQQFLVVKDEEGTLRPQSGCWRNTQEGRMSADIYLSKNPDVTVVIINVEEV